MIQDSDFDRWEIIEHLHETMRVLDMIPEEFQDGASRKTRKHILAKIINHLNGEEGKEGKK